MYILYLAYSPQRSRKFPCLKFFGLQIHEELEKITITAHLLIYTCSRFTLRQEIQVIVEKKLLRGIKTDSNM